MQILATAGPDGNAGADGSLKTDPARLEIAYGPGGWASPRQSVSGQRDE